MSATAQVLPAAQARGAARMARIFAALLSADMVTRLLAAVATVVVVRSLAPDAFGEVAYSLAAAAVLGVLVDLGFSLLLIRDVSEDPARAPFLLGGVLKAVAMLSLALFGAGAVLSLAGAAPGPASGAVMALGLAVMAANALIRPFEATLTGCGRAHLVTVAHFLRGTTLVAATATVALAAPSPATFLVAVVAAELVGLLALNRLCRARVCRPELGVSTEEILSLLRRALPFALLAGFGLLYLRLDTIMLGLLGSGAAVGNYGVAMRVLETTIALPAFFGGAFLATVAQTGAATERAASQTARAMRYLLLVSVPLAFGLAVAADPLVTAVAGSRYEQAGGILLRLSPVLVLTAAYAVLANLQIALGRTGLLVKISLAGIGVKIALNAWAIPRYGADGAALAAVAGETMVVIAQWYSARRRFDAARLLAWCGRLGVSAAAMVAVGSLVAIGFPWPTGLAGGLAAFVVTAWATECVSVSELRVAWASVSARAS